MGDEQLQPTSATEWRKPREEGYVVTLPSGNVARLRPVALDALVTAGEIPDTLTPLAARMMWQTGSSDEADEPEQEDQSFERGKQSIEFTNLIVRSAMIEPRICEEDCEVCEEDCEVCDDCILIEDIDFDDRIAIQRLVLRSAEAMRRFRDKQAANVEAVPDSEDTQPETE